MNRTSRCIFRQTRATLHLWKDSWWRTAHYFKSLVLQIPVPFQWLILHHLKCWWHQADCFRPSYRIIPKWFRFSSGIPNWQAGAVSAHLFQPLSSWRPWVNAYGRSSATFLAVNGFGTLFKESFLYRTIVPAGLVASHSCLSLISMDPTTCNCRRSHHAPIHRHRNRSEAHALNDWEYPWI
jgi:hypothetical protein